LFNKVGAFSARFGGGVRTWLKVTPNDDRLMHRSSKTPPANPTMKFWLQTGTKDETADRNKNGIIDSIDDTIDIIKELLAKGFERPADIQYLLK
jgi:enterochelin esterase family protein